MRSMSDWDRVKRWLPLLVIGGGLLAYAGSFSGAFLFDDQMLIINNPRIHQLWPPWAAVAGATRWVADVSFALNYAVSRFNVADYHATNLLIHILAGLLLYGLVHRTLRLPRWGGRYDGAAAWLALAVALLWVVHPLTTAAVTYIIQRIESLMAMFYLLGLYLFSRGAGSARPRGWLNASIVVCAVGLGTKEILVTLPVAIWLYDWVFVAESWHTLWRARWKYYAALALTWCLFGLLYLQVLPVLELGGGLCPPEITPALYLLTEAGVILRYLQLALAPHPLCFDYGWPIAAGVREAVVPGLAVLGLLGLTVWGLVKRRWWGFPGALFFLVLAPTSSVLPLPDPLFEHRMYLPLTAVVALVTAGSYAGLEWIGRRTGARRAMQAAGWVTLALALAVLVLLTRARNRDYVSEEVLWRDSIRKRPDNYRAYIGASKGLIDHGKFQEAAAMCSNVLSRMPDFQRMSAAQLAQQQAGSWTTRVNLRHYSAIRNHLGIALLDLGLHDQARACYEESLRANPENVQAIYNLAFELYRCGETNRALLKCGEVLKWEPGNPSAHAFMGMVWEEKGQIREAIRHYREALRTNPDKVGCQFRLALLLATAADAEFRDGPAAVRMATHMVRATYGKSVRAWDLLGVAYAETGAFTNAVLAAENALQVARGHELKALPAGLALPTMALDQKQALDPSCSLDEIVARLEGFRQRKPFHQQAPKVQ